jgi:dihydroflavonol-4-reductase
MGKLGDRFAEKPPLTEQVALMAARRWFYDDTKAREELGYRSRPLEETLRDALAWFTVRGLG